MTALPTRLRVGIDTRLAPCAPEVLYTLRTLCELAGYARDVVWLDAASSGAAAGAGPRLDLYYGPEPEASGARVAIRWAGRDLREARDFDVTAHVEHEGAPYVGFGGEPALPPQRAGDALVFASDLAFAAFWWLTGAREHTYSRDRWFNISLRGSYLVSQRLIERPVISLWAQRIREHLEAAGALAMRPDFAQAGGSALTLSHDVDYPEIVRWVELLRAPLAGARGLRALRHMASARAFWRFAEWADFAETLGGARSCFYFMARQGSLLKYLRGDPDAFYDVRAPHFRAVIAELRARGCEIGLHASFNSPVETARLAAEKARIEEVAGAPIAGNRSHYWRLDPTLPHETLAALERAGFLYDTTLGYEFYPGFRRGVCHPYFPWHPAERRQLGILEFAPTWMDNQYDGRLPENGIADPIAHAQHLLAQIAQTGGVAVIDYHVRGMSPAFPWGAWLRSWLPEARPRTMRGDTPERVARSQRAHAARLASESREILPAS
ncbi:MAG TPA: polysaccharide deacetylase family protein [Myxococcota bacterium]|jgi:hypothetical protein